MIDYSLNLIGDQVIIEIKTIDPSIADYQSEDGFLSIRKVAGGCDGWLGYGGLYVNYDARYLPMTLETPHYEHAQDLADVMERITRNMEVLNNGDVLP